VLATLTVVACEKTEATASAPPSAPQRVSRPAPLPDAALRRDLRLCEQTAPGDTGQTEFGVRVDPNGKVVLAKALHSTSPPALLNCSLQRLRAWSFAPSDAGAAFRFSMAFGRVQEPSGGTAGKPADKKLIKNTSKHRTSALQHCYNATLRNDPSVMGTVSFDIVIAVTGEVRDVDIQVAPNTYIPFEMQECMADKIRAWRFPMNGAETGADVSFTVVFSPS